MFDLSKFVGGIVSPKVGLALVRNRLQAEINKALKARDAKSLPVTIENYTLNIILSEPRAVYFLVNGVKFPYEDSDALTRLVVSMVKEKFDGEIDLILINYFTDRQPVLTCGYRDKEGIKKVQTIEI